MHLLIMTVRQIVTIITREKQPEVRFIQPGHVHNY